jgi:hypothetical protein
MTISRDDHVSSRSHRGSKNLIVIGIVEDDRGDDSRNDDLHQGSVAVKQFAHIDTTPGKLPAELGAIQYVAQFGQKRKAWKELDAFPTAKSIKNPGQPRQSRPGSYQVPAARLRSARYAATSASTSEAVIGKSGGTVTVARTACIRSTRANANRSLNSASMTLGSSSPS